MRKEPKTVWQVRIGNDGYGSNETDTVSLKQLPDACEIESTAELAERAGRDPYSNATAPAGQRRHRRTLDDMRKLDEEIKRARASKMSATHAPSVHARPKRSVRNAVRAALARWLGKNQT